MSSITFGAPIDPYDGYRKELHQKLTDRGNVVDFVGAVTSGDFSDNQHEGHRGKIIDEIADESSVGIYAAPNIVLVHAGTNDMNRDIDVANAPARLSSLIQLIYDHSPDAVVFVAQIIPSTTTSTLNNVKNFNKAIPGLVDDWLDKGKKIYLVDMFDALDKDKDLYDSLHPNFGGYTKMANTWYNAITSADSRGWITSPGVAQTPPNNATSDCGLTGTWQPKGEIATGPHAYGRRPFRDMQA